MVALVVGGGSFFAGMKYQEAKTSNNNPNRQFQRGMGGQGTGGTNGQAGMNRFGGGSIIGEIISSDDKTITVKLEDGSSKIVLLSDTMTISKTDTGSKVDMKVGTRVGVFGSTNSDGTVTAQNVQLNPIFRMRPTGSGQDRFLSSPTP